MNHAIYTKSRLRTKRSAFSLIELLVTVGIISILGCILLPMVGKMKESANKAKCLSNLKQIGAATFSYASDHGTFPIASLVDGEEAYGFTDNNWMDALSSYVSVNWTSSALKNRQAYGVYICPSEPKPETMHFYTYAMNIDARPDTHDHRLLKPQELANPASYLLFVDSANKNYVNGATITTINQSKIDGRHGGHPNILYGDGHCGTWSGTIAGYRDGNPREDYIKLWRWDGQPN